MEQIRIVAIPTKVAESVRGTGRAPVYGRPAHTELGTDSAPCRHCLRLITPGIDRRILFTYDRFAGVESLPLPGPTENAGFPDELRASPHTLEGYARGRHLVAREYVMDGKMERVIEQLFASSDGDYIHVNSTTAGCYTFRIERWDRAICQPGGITSGYLVIVPATRILDTLVLTGAMLMTSEAPFAIRK